MLSVANQPPEILGWSVSPVPSSGGTRVQVVCKATDPEGQSLTYRWSTGNGSLSNGDDLDAIVNWTLPEGEGNFMLSVEVRDAQGAATIAERLIPVGPIRVYNALAATWRHPTRIAIDTDGTLWITDASLDQVFHLHADGRLLGQFATGPRPLGIAIAQDGNILVGEDGLNCVARYTPGGTRLGALGNGAIDIAVPNAIAVDPLSGRVHVVDSQNQRVRVFTAEGSLATSYGGPGSLEFPIDIAIDAQRNEVFIADQEAAKIVVYNLSGTKLRTLGSRGNFPGQFNRLQGIALDTDGNLLALDAHQSHIQLLTPAGNHLATFGQLGVGTGAMRIPLGIASVSGERIFVTSATTGAVQVFAHWTWFNANGASGRGVLLY